MKPSELEQYRNKNVSSLPVRKKSVQKKQKKPGMVDSTLMFRRHYYVSIMVVVITLVSVVFFGSVGRFLDQYLSTNNAFFVFGLLISFPISQFTLYKWVKEKYIPSVKKLNKNT